MDLMIDILNSGSCESLDTSLMSSTTPITNHANKKLGNIKKKKTSKTNNMTQ